MQSARKGFYIKRDSVCYDNIRQLIQRKLTPILQKDFHHKGHFTPSVIQIEKGKKRIFSNSVLSVDKKNPPCIECVDSLTSESNIVILSGQNVPCYFQIHPACLLLHPDVPSSLTPTLLPAPVRSMILQHMSVCRSVGQSSTLVLTVFTESELVLACWTHMGPCEGNPRPCFIKGRQSSIWINGVI